MGYVSAGRGAMSYVRAEASLLVRGPLDPAAVSLRLAQCMDCTARVPSEQVGFCSACRCPHWRRSELGVKATMPAAICPRDRWAKA